MKTTIIFALLVLLSGCGTDPKWMENRVACTVDKSEAFVISKWGPLAIGSPLAKADAATICVR